MEKEKSRDKDQHLSFLMRLIAGNDAFRTDYELVRGSRANLYSVGRTDEQTI